MAKLGEGNVCKATGRNRTLEKGNNMASDSPKAPHMQSVKAKSIELLTKNIRTRPARRLSPSGEHIHKSFIGRGRSDEFKDWVRAPAGIRAIAKVDKILRKA